MVMGHCLSCQGAIPIAPVSQPPQNAPPEEEEEEDDEGPFYYSFPEFFASSPTRQLAGMRFERELGKGAMSRVYLAVNEATDQQVAVKIYNNAHLYKPVLGPEEPLYQQVQREVNLMVTKMRFLQNPHSKKENFWAMVNQR
jgi:serine/threonine protein kinase